MEALSPDTQATLLLVGRFSKSPEAKPLSAAEYNKLAKHIHDLGMRPADLLSELPAGLPIERDRAKGLLGRGTSLALAVERWGQIGIKIVGRGDAAYPSLLKTKLRGRAPPILYIAGNAELLDRKAVCIVGSREATQSGLAYAAELGRQCAKEGLIVVSGDARGVDRTAMEASLDEGGSATGVLAEALAKAVLAKRHRNAILAGNLALVSPYDPDATFTVANAMDRNKYMYALSSAAVIVESGVNGGTWAGAVENEKHRWARAFVRLTDDAPLGNRRLAELGVQPLTGLQNIAPMWLQNLVAQSDSVGAARPDMLAFKETGAEVLNAPPSSILFDVFTESLRKWLAGGPQTDDAIAKKFDLEQSQAKRWLERAQSLGLVRRSDSSDPHLVSNSTN